MRRGIFAVVMALSLASLSGCGVFDLGGSGRDPHVFLDTDKIGTGQQAMYQGGR